MPIAGQLQGIQGHNINFVRYNDFELGIERVVRWEQRAVYDESGVDFLYNHITIGVQCVVSPAELATKTAEGAWAPVTIADLRSLLMIPRRDLLVRIGDYTVIQSPAERPNADRPFQTDCKNGPQPLAFNVLHIIGPKTAICYYEIETWVNDCVDALTPVLLSHRWEMAHEIDDRFYTTRTISGTAVFRSDFLLDDPIRGNRTPDNFRTYFNHPIPDNFKRDSVRVTASPDGLALRYQIRDVEQDVNLGINNPVVKIQGSYRFGLHSPGGNYALFQYGHTYVGLAIQVWGKRTSTKQQLINACVQAALAFKFCDPRVRASYFKSDWVVHLDKRYVELSMGAMIDGNTVSMISGAFDAGAAIGGGFQFFNAFPEGIPGVADDASTNNPRPPTAGVRGTYVGRLALQALSQPCTAPLAAQLPVGAGTPESTFS